MCDHINLNFLLFIIADVSCQFINSIFLLLLFLRDLLFQQLSLISIKISSSLEDIECCILQTLKCLKTVPFSNNDEGHRRVVRDTKRDSRRERE